MLVEDLTRAAVAALEDVKARDIVVLDVRRLTSLFDIVIVASADSARQTRSLASHVLDRAKELGAGVIGVEGEVTGEWVLVDLGDVVVHVMQPAVRDYYNLEELWGGQRPSPRRPHAGAGIGLAHSGASV
jgi:ribosome-associated protein